MAAPITELHEYGWIKEKEFHPVIAHYLADGVCKRRKKRFEVMDFYTASWDADLKARPPLDKKGNEQDSTTFNYWVVPSVKMYLSEKPNKAVFYYWEGDNSLWRTNYDEDLWRTYKTGIPQWHTAHHFFVPREHFIQIEFDEAD